MEKYGSIQGVVNCAGLGTATRVVGKKGVFPLDEFNFVVQVNLVGTFNVIRLAAAAMTTNEPNEHGERGVIVNTASVAAYDDDGILSCCNAAVQCTSYTDRNCFTGC